MNTYKYQFTNDPGVVPYLNGTKTPHHFIMYDTTTADGPCKMLLPYEVSKDDPTVFDWDEEKLAFDSEELARKFSDHVGVTIIEDNE